MSKPIPGQYYTVVKNDWLSTIARDAYYDLEKWVIIRDANPHIYGRGNAIDGSPLIFPDDELYIPELPEEEGDIQTFAQQQEMFFSLVVEGDMVPVETAELTEAMDAGADMFTATLDPDKLEARTRDFLKPYRYPKCRVSINGELRLTGYVYVIESAAQPNSRTLKITGYSKTKNLVDSVVNPPYEVTGTTLKKRANKLCSDLGLSPVFDFGADEVFDRITSREGEKRYAHLTTLARERGILVSCTAQGNPLFQRAAAAEKPIDALEEGQQGALGFSAKFDGTERFSSYRVVGANITGEPVTSTVPDSAVNLPRYTSEKMRRAANTSTKTAANWARSRAVAKALSLPITADSFVTREGKVWQKNKYVTLKSETLFLPDGYDLLIRRIKFVFKPDARTAVLDLVPREVFTEEAIPDIWS